MSEPATTDTSGAIATIESVLASIRPAVRADGGDIEFVDFDAASGRVRVRLVGACHACPMSLATLRAGVEQRLRMLLPEVRSVEAL